MQSSWQYCVAYGELSNVSHYQYHDNHHCYKATELAVPANGNQALTSRSSPPTLRGRHANKKITWKESQSDQMPQFFWIPYIQRSTKPCLWSKQWIEAKYFLLNILIKPLWTSSAWFSQGDFITLFYSQFSTYKFMGTTHKKMEGVGIPKSSFPWFK